MALQTSMGIDLDAVLGVSGPVLMAAPQDQLLLGGDDGGDLEALLDATTLLPPSAVVDIVFTQDMSWDAGLPAPGPAAETDGYYYPSEDNSWDWSYMYDSDGSWDDKSQPLDRSRFFH